MALRKINTIASLLFISATFVVGQNSILEDYIKTGLNENLALRQKELSFEKSMAALREAKGLFLPQLSFQARYSVAQGGRTIDLPIGDMLNPVYSTLNQLTQTFPDPFPILVLDNEEINFLRPTEHETKLRMVQSVYNPQIRYNKRIKDDLVQVSRADENAFKQELIYEIKSAYFNYLKTVSVLELLKETKNLVDENIRVNEKLFQNSKITIDILYRAKAEKSRIEYSIALAEKDSSVASSYFNFLLNRPFRENIKIDSSIYVNTMDLYLEESIEKAWKQRYELDILNYYASVSDHHILLNKTGKLPNLVAVMDYGFQGETYKFDGESDYIMASAVLQWDLFKGFQNNAKIQQTQIAKHQLEIQVEETRNKIKLEVENAYFEVQAAFKAIDAAWSEKEAMDKAFLLVSRKYTNEQATLLEFIDARNTCTMASEKLIIAQYDALIKLANFDRVTGQF